MTLDISRVDVVENPTMEPKEIKVPKAFGLAEGQIVTVKTYPNHEHIQQVDPVTRKTTGKAQEFKVVIAP